MPKNAELFNCEKCNFICSKKSNYTKHLMTAKHKILTNTYIKMPKKCQSEYTCECGKVYKHRQSLYSHKMKCSQYTSNTESYEDYQREHITPNIVTQLLLQNQEFKDMIIEQQEENHKLQNKLIEAVKINGSTTNNTINNTTNNNNQKFNLNFFLNTTCKDAMNMSEFIENIEVNFKDIENIGKNGYVSGMTDMILSRIKELDVTKRPMHCTDLKRETMYIKDNDEWAKDTPENTKLHQMIDYMAKQNYAKMPLWRQRNPECLDSDHPKYDFCIKMMRNMLGDVGAEQVRLDNKVIKNLSKHILVDKAVN